MLACIFSLQEIGDRLICSETFEMASLMASRHTFRLVIPVFDSLYRGLKGVAHVAKPSYSRPFCPSHYLYRWLYHYFQTHHVLCPAPSGPLVMRYFGPLTKHSNIGMFVR